MFESMSRMTLWKSHDGGHFFEGKETANYSNIVVNCWVIFQEHSTLSGFCFTCINNLHPTILRGGFSPEQQNAKSKWPRKTKEWRYSGIICHIDQLEIQDGPVLLSAISSLLDNHNLVPFFFFKFKALSECCFSFSTKFTFFPEYRNIGIGNSRLELLDVIIFLCKSTKFFNLNFDEIINQFCFCNL